MPSATPHMRHENDEILKATVIPDAKWLHGALWHGASDDIRPYALIDGNWCVGLYGRLLNSSLSWCSLYQGQTAGEQLQNAPFLIELKTDDPLVRWLLEAGWGQGWGIYCLASTSALRKTYRQPDPRKLEEMRGRGHFIAAPQAGQDTDVPDPLMLLRQHFRRFTEVEFEDDGRLVMFRFYDPAVLRTWLASCNSNELATIFGPIRAFNAEAFNELPSLNRPREMHQYSLVDQNGKMVLSALCRDIEAGVKRPLPMPAPSAETAARAGGPHLMLRNGQIAAFKSAQMAKFQEEVALELTEGVEGLDALALDEARLMVDRHAPQGRELGLSTRADLRNFVVCRLRYGDDFPDNSEVVKTAFLQRSELSPESATDLSSLLMRAAKQDQRGRSR